MYGEKPSQGQLALSFASAMTSDLPPDYHASDVNTGQYPLESIPNGTGSSQGLSRSKHTAELKSPRRKRYMYMMFFAYAAISITAWIILCHIGRGPVRTSDDNLGWQHRRLKWAYEPEMGRRSYRAATVLSTIAAVMTIPTAATVCAYAAVPFSQYQMKGKNLSLRQVLTLADRGWMSPHMVIKALLPVDKHTHGSPFLWYAAAIIFIGEIPSPFHASGESRS